MSRDQLEKVLESLDAKVNVTDELWDSLCERVNDAAKRIVSDLIEGEDALAKRTGEEISQAVQTCLELSKKDAGLSETQEG